MVIRKITDRKPNIIIFNGSPRRLKSCANQVSKTQKIIQHTIEKFLPFANFDVIDLSVGQVNIQPCKGCMSTSNGFQCHWKCVSSNQRVHTIDGFREISQLKIGDILQDGNKIINHLKTSDSEDIYELKLTDGRKIEITSEHRVKVLSKERFRSIESNWKFYRKEEWVELKNIRIGDNIPKIEIDEIYKYSEIDDIYEIYGLIWGDGTLTSSLTLLYCDSKEYEYIENIKNKFKEYIISILPHNINNNNNISGKEYNTKMIKINFGSKLGKQIINDGFIKGPAKERRLPIQSFKNKNQIFNFISGWISTDGTVTDDGICIYNTSYDCLRDLQLLLSRINIISNVIDNRHRTTMVRNKKCQGVSSLVISDQDSKKILFDNIKLINVKKQIKFEKSILKKRKIKFSFSKVKSIKYIGKKSVYDIEVDQSHEFNCEGIKIHNCSCFRKGDKVKTDLMYESDIYDKLEQCDGFVVVSPIHWYSVSTQVKAMFDRLVCANQTITKDQAIDIFGKGNIKNSELTGQVELYGQHKHLLKNHLEGKWAAFYVHGDNGANDYDGNPPETGDKAWDVKNSVMPLVYQCRYSGINAPDDLVEAFYINQGKPYYQANLDFDSETEYLNRMNNLIDKLLNYLK